MPPDAGTGAHLTDVSENHEVVEQTVPPTIMVGDLLSAAKLIPVTVNVDEPEVAPFCPRKFVMTGPSYVTPEARATFMALDNSVYLASCCLPAPDAALAITLVNETHEVVVAMVVPKNTVGVMSVPLPRAVPLRVT